LGVRGKSPGGVLGAKPPEAERFSFFEGDCCIKMGRRRPSSVEDLAGTTRGRGGGRKGGLQPPAPVSATDGNMATIWRMVSIVTFLTY